MLHAGYLWNSGIFVWKVGDFLSAILELTPEVAPALEENDAKAYFAKVTPVSVDVGVLERSHRVRVIRGDFGWDDVGTWAALRRVKPENESGNVVTGDVHTVESLGNVVHASDATVVLYGVNDLVVVTSGGVTLVTTTDRSHDLKALLDSLPEKLGGQT